MPSEPERYDPMPGIAELPGWLWRRTPRAQRLAAGVVLLALVAAIVVLAPRIADDKQRRNEAEQTERERARAASIERQRREQRPVRAHSGAATPPGTPPGRAVGRRTAMLDDIAAAILADARRRAREGRLDAPAKRVTCERFPRTVGEPLPQHALGERRMRLSCTAVTSEFDPGTGRTGVIGHPYRVLADFRTGLFTFCKTTGVAGPARDQPVTVPPACGGRA